MKVGKEENEKERDVEDLKLEIFGSLAGFWKELGVEKINV